MQRIASEPAQSANQLWDGFMRKGEGGGGHKHGALTCILVSDEVNIHNLAILREDGKQVSLSQVVRESTGKYVSGVLKFCMPRRRVANALGYLPLRCLLCIFDLSQRIHAVITGQLRRKGRRSRKASQPGFRPVLANSVVAVLCSSTLGYCWKGKLAASGTR
jgi:hypothetical protein